MFLDLFMLMFIIAWIYQEFTCVLAWVYKLRSDTLWSRACVSRIICIHVLLVNLFLALRMLMPVIARLETMWRIQHILESRLAHLKKKIINWMYVVIRIYIHKLALSLLLALFMCVIVNSNNLIRTCVGFRIAFWHEKCEIEFVFLKAS